MNYDVNYFINKFEAIPEDDWGNAKLENHCALYHCGLIASNYTHTPESRALLTLFMPRGRRVGTQGDFHFIWEINDGIGEYRLLGKTPKERILNKLYQIRDGNNMA